MGFEIGDEVWVAAPYETGPLPVQAKLTACIVGGWEPIYTVEYEGRKYDVLASQIFDHEPSRAIVTDELGSYTEWR